MVGSGRTSTESHTESVSLRPVESEQRANYSCRCLGVVILLLVLSLMAAFVLLLFCTPNQPQKTQPVVVYYIQEKIIWIRSTFVLRTETAYSGVFGSNRPENTTELPVNDKQQMPFLMGRRKNPKNFEKVSERLKKTLNLSADPCTDFYEFTCGGWIANHEIPDDGESVNAFSLVSDKVELEMKALYESTEKYASKAIEQVKLIYKACMDEEEINRVSSTNLLRSVKEIGFWPLLNDADWHTSTFDLSSYLSEFFKKRGFLLFTTVNVEIDLKNASRRLLSFDEGSLGIGFGSRSYYVEGEKYSKQMSAYKKLLVSTAQIFMNESHIHFDRSLIERQVDDVIQFETNLAKIQLHADERLDWTKRYNVIKLDYLDTLISAMNLRDIFEKTSPPEILTYLASNPDVSVSEMEYYGKLSDLLKSTEPPVLANYILLRFITSGMSDLGTVYEDLKQDFDRALFGIEKKDSRWKKCVKTANHKMKFASGAMYVRAHYEQETRENVESIIEEVRNVFLEMLDENTWMDDRTRELAKQKALYMMSRVGHAEFILDDEKLDEFYELLNVQSDDSYFDMVEEQLRFALDFHYKRLMKPVDRANEFKFHPTTVNAWNNLETNVIYITAAIQQAPFFDLENPMAFNFAGIGDTIGHEITHGFDDQGRQFGVQGPLHKWWDEKTFREYNKRAKCLIDQYSSNEVEDTGIKINGKLTLGENIADNGGNKEAFRAYKRYLAKNGPETRIPDFEQFTNEQMFYIGRGMSRCTKNRRELQVELALIDTHAPARNRLNIPLQNMPEFADAFKCPVGSRMNPAERCTVW